jgi:catechol 2,3-dioxygenase-like lactoylglutathione lyase family enzyme
VTRIGLVTLVVSDYDEAIDYFVGAIGFRLVEDTPMDGGRRWVVVAPRADENDTALLLARAAADSQAARVGDQTGGRVAFFLETDDFWGDYERMTACGVNFTHPPREEPYGIVAVFEDLYGNRWDLLEPRRAEGR